MAHEHYQMQVQHYLAVSGFDYWYIAALIFGKEFLIRKIERDEELIQYLITIEEKFWNENVLQNIMPDPDGTKACTEAITKYSYESNRLDARKLKEEQPDIYKEYCRINSTRRFTVSHAA